MTASKAIRIAMWCAPRTLSTATMRSFGSRSDTTVSDEPFYGCFLKATGADHPMAAEVIASMDCDWWSVTAALNGPVPGGLAIWYQKHMPHQMTGPVNYADLPDHRHAFLIRDPRYIVASYRQKHVAVTVEEIGYDRMVAYFRAIRKRDGTPPPVIDSNHMLHDPEAHLRWLCEKLGIAFDPAMLRWEPGQRITDGAWAPHWYNSVMQSTGFGPPRDDLPELEGRAAEVAERCRSDYEELLAFAPDIANTGDELASS